MDYSQLVELADREIRCGLADESLMAAALREAGQLPAKADAVYWRLRAAEWQSRLIADGAASLADRVKVIEARERALARRRLGREWGWVGVCFLSIAGCFVCSRLAYHLLLRGAAEAWVLAAASLGFLVLTGVAWSASRSSQAPD